MTFPTTGLLDDFNRADGSAGANWGSDPFNSNSEVLTIRTNQAGSPTTRTAFGTEGWWSASDFGPDSECYITIAALPSNANFIYCWARGQTPSTSASTMDCYECEWQYNSVGNATITLYRVIDTVSTQIAQSNSQTIDNLAVGDKLGIEVTGTGATVTVRALKFQSGVWTQILTVGDTDALRITAAGNIGCGVYDGTGTTGLIDDFSGGTLGGVVTGAPVLGPAFQPLPIMR